MRVWGAISVWGLRENWQNDVFCLVEGLHPIWSDICRKFQKKTPLGWLEIIQSLLGSCKAEFIQELDAQKKMGPPGHHSGKSCEMMKASILLQVTLPEKK